MSILNFILFYFYFLYDFKDYFPFTVIKKYLLYSLCTIHPWAWHSTVYTSLSYPFIALPPPWVTTNLFSISVSLLLLCRLFRNLLHFLDSTYKWYHTAFILLWLVSLSIISSKSMHPATNGKFLFYLWLSSIPLYITSLSIHLLMDT